MNNFTKQELTQFCQLNNISIEIGNHISKNKDIYCKCGNFKKTFNSTQAKYKIAIYRCCGEKECEPNYGKKRPNQSSIMKKLVINGSKEYKNTLIKPGELRNKKVNTIEFKKARLKNNNIDVGGLSDNEIENRYRKVLSETMLHRNTKSSYIITRYKSWELSYKKLILLLTNNNIPTFQYLNKLSDKQLEYLYSETHSLNTIRYLENKIMSAIEYSKERNYHFILTHSLPDSEYNFIKNAYINTGVKINVKN